MSIKQSGWRGLWMYGAFLGILIAVYWFFFRDKSPSATAIADAPGGGGGSGGGGGGDGGGNTANPLQVAGKPMVYIPDSWYTDILDDNETVTIDGVDYTGSALDPLTTYQRMQIIHDLISGLTFFDHTERRKLINRIASYYKKSDTYTLIEKYKTQTGGDLVSDLQSEIYYDAGVFYYFMMDN